MLKKIVPSSWVRKFIGTKMPLLLQYIVSCILVERNARKHQLCFAVRKGKGCTGVHLFVKKKMNDKFAKIRQLPGASPPDPSTGICPGPNEGITARGPQTLSGFLRTLHFQPGYAPGIRRQISRKPNLIGYNPPLVFMSLTLSYWLIPISQLVFMWEMVRF